MSAPRSPMPIGSTRWVVTLAAMTAVIALSIDMSLPAQPTLAATFEVEDATAGLTLSVFMIGFALAQLVVGYLSDAWGRRRVLLGGLAMFSLAAIACALSPSIEVLLICRALQGIGGSVAPVVARAMVRDTQPAQQAARLLSTMLATLAIAPMIAPSIGGVLLATLGWRSIFATLALCGAVLMVIAYRTLSETLPVERRLVASPLGLIRGFRTFFTTPGTRLPILISCASFAGQFAYIADSPFVYMEGFHTSSETFGILFGLTALALMIGALLGGSMLNAGRSPGAMIVIGTAILVFGGIAVTIGTRVPGFGIAGFLVPMIIYFFGVGIASPSATALALEPVPHIAGTASSAIGFLTMTSGALAGYGTTKLGGSDPQAFALVVAVMAVVSASIALLTVALRRRRRQKQQESR
ncbi:MAG: multidrug effflux MFS transporter [Myxococcales bacterium]|nr:multidrug effflux MFS transporter [Myxococcales bacterium]